MTARVPTVPQSVVCTRAQAVFPAGHVASQVSPRSACDSTQVWYCPLHRTGVPSRQVFCSKSQVSLPLHAMPSSQSASVVHASGTHSPSTSIWKRSQTHVPSGSVQCAWLPHSMASSACTQVPDATSQVSVPLHRSPSSQSLSFVHGSAAISLHSPSMSSNPWRQTHALIFGLQVAFAPHVTFWHGRVSSISSLQALK